MTAVRKRGAQAKAGHPRTRVVLVGGIFVALLAVAGVVGRGFLAQPTTPPAASQYRGIVQFAGQGGECERFEFDNQSGTLSPQDRVWCRDRTATTGVARQATEPSGQLTGVRDYFKPP